VGVDTHNNNNKSNNYKIYNTYYNNNNVVTINKIYNSSKEMSKVMFQVLISVPGRCKMSLCLLWNTKKWINKRFFLELGCFISTFRIRRIASALYRKKNLSQMKFSKRPNLESSCLCRCLVSRIAVQFVDFTTCANTVQFAYFLRAKDTYNKIKKFIT
jgi:hypothetical protein